MMVVGAIVLALSVLVWLALLLMLAELNTSDAAGNGMTQGFARVAVDGDVEQVLIPELFARLGGLRSTGVIADHLDDELTR